MAGDQDLVTLIGLFIEAYAGLVPRLTKSLQAEIGAAAQWMPILIRLARSPGDRLRMSDLAAQTGMSASGLTRAVDRLEEHGLVERASCPTDARGWFAVLTPAGKRLMEPALRTHASDIREMLDGVLDDREIEDLATLLRKLRDSVNPTAAQVTTA
jgi:DNA-binding MarR family transcriptional regulator